MANSIEDGRANVRSYWADKRAEDDGEAGTYDPEDPDDRADRRERSENEGDRRRANRD